MQKVFLFFLGLFLYSPACSFLSYADSPPVTAIAQGPIVPLDDQEVEKLEADLRKIKEEHLHQEQKRRVRVTQKVYKEGVGLYKQQRLRLAKDTLGKVQNLMEGYKSTDTILNKIDQQDLEKLRRQMRRKRVLESPQLLIDLTKKAEDLEAQAEYLGDDQYTAVVKKKLIMVRKVLEKLKRERLAVSPRELKQLRVQEQLDQVHEKAEDFDQEIYQLIQSKDYPAARKKYDEFQHAMMDDLAKIKKTMTSEDGGNLKKGETQ